MKYLEIWGQILWDDICSHRKILWNDIYRHKETELYYSKRNKEEMDIFKDILKDIAKIRLKKKKG